MRIPLPLGATLGICSAVIPLLGCVVQMGPPPPRVVARPVTMGPQAAPNPRGLASRALDPGSPPAAARPAPPAPMLPARRDDADLDIDRPDPESRRLFLDRLAQPSIAAAKATPRVTAIALENTARGEAIGASPDGEPNGATLAEGQRITMAVAVGPGECATFIAQGGLGVIEVDLFLTQGTGPGVQILAQDTASGPIAVIGGRGKCFRTTSATRITADLHAVVRRGGGAVLVRTFRGPSPGGAGAASGAGATRPR